MQYGRFEFLTDFSAVVSAVVLIGAVLLLYRAAKKFGRRFDVHTTIVEFRAVNGHSISMCNHQHVATTTWGRLWMHRPSATHHPHFVVLTPEMRRFRNLPNLPPQTSALFEALEENVRSSEYTTWATHVSFSDDDTVLTAKLLQHY